MDSDGYRRMGSKGEFVLPKEFRQRHDLSPGDKVFYKNHSTDKSKLIIQAPE